MEDQWWSWRWRGNENETAVMSCRVKRCLEGGHYWHTRTGRNLTEQPWGREPKRGRCPEHGGKLELAKVERRQKNVG